jgi:hypothetical protein
VLGIEPTELAPQSDPCAYVPHAVHFADKLADGAEIRVGMLTAGELGQLVASVGVEPAADRGHVLVRALDCDLEPAEDVRLELRLGDTMSVADAASVTVDDAGLLLGDDSSDVGLVGVLNAPPDSELKAWLFPELLASEGQESAIGDVVARAGALASIELFPNSEVEADPLPVIEPWTCVGSIDEPVPPGPGAVTLHVNVVAAPGLVPRAEPIGGVRVHACVDAMVACEDSPSRVTEVTDASGGVELTVGSETGLFDGYVLVEGSVPGCDP